ncbi:MAG TPA: hypothetical protein VI968_02910 [archaeon]|nr:hypothetical protein [archaeon]
MKLYPILLAIGLSGVPKYVMRGHERTVEFKGYADVDCDGMAEDVEVYGRRSSRGCSTAIIIRKQGSTSTMKNINGYPVGKIKIEGHEVSFDIDTDGDMKADGHYRYPSCNSNQ